MKLLLIILAVMTWTVKDKNTVSGEGQLPSGIEDSYSCTYQKGQVRAGDEAVLTLSHMEGIQVDKVTMYMKSNASSGAGNITVIANDETVATKSGDYKSWTGAYDGTNYHAVTVLNKSVPDVDELIIRLTGTEKTLYIEKYVIEYQPRPSFTVTLQNGMVPYGSISEIESGAGVILPALPDSAEWHFEGWSETHFWTVYERPTPLYAAYSSFYPTRDLILWAVYRYMPEQKKQYATELVSGEYMYVHSTADYALTGFPHDNIMDFATIDENDENQHYWIDFVAPDTAYITHMATGAPVGYKGTSMALKESPWLVAHEGDATTFYTIVKNKKYVLFFPNMNSAETSKHAGLLLAEPVNSPFKLLIPDVQELVYTCHPENGVGIENVRENPSSDQETVVRFGIYELHVKDGKKEIRL